MQKLTIFPSFVAIFLFSASLITLTEGLECFECMSDDGLPRDDDLEEQGFFDIVGHRSCERGHIPEKGLSLECDSPRGERSAPVCMQVYMTNLKARDGSPGNFSVNGRGCFHTNTSVVNFTMRMEHFDMTIEDLTNMALGKWKNVFELALSTDRFDLATRVDLDYCKRDNCNSAPALLKGGIGWITSLSFLIWLSSVALSAASFGG